MRVFDIESTGLLPWMVSEPERIIDRVQCINGYDRRTGRRVRFTDHEFYQDLAGNYTTERTPRDGDIKDGLYWLEEAECIAGHNIISYDVPALKHIYPGFNPPASQFDSKLLGKLAVPTLKDKDWANKRKGKLPDDFPAGSQQLKHWALRVGKHLKTDFDPADYGHTWKTMPFTKEMDDYCMDDVIANVDVIEFMEDRLLDCPEAVRIETEVWKILCVQQAHGIRFDTEAAEKLASELYVKLHELEQQARSAFPPFYLKDKEFTPKRDNAKLGYVQGAPMTKVKLIEFNPGSRPQIENRLRAKYDWEPTEFTEKGQAKIDEDVLGSLPFPEARIIAEYFTVQKRLSQLAEGKQAWLKADRGGRIYGRVDPLGTGTGRMSHYGPNLAQVPKVGKPYGEECRSLFLADEGRVLVGMDADALELRILAHFLGRFDGGEYVATVLSGNKDDGTDMHTRNQQAIGLQLRDTAKTWFYAFIYGAGNFKLGTIVISEWDEEKLLNFYKKFPPGERRRKAIARLGKRSRDRLLSDLPAFGRLVTQVHTNCKRGYLLGLDRRKVYVRSQHSALNFLCQGAGAIAMKQALILMFESFKRHGLEVIPVLNVHDEVQLIARKEEAEDVGRIAALSVGRAGEYFGLRCPLEGNYDIGQNWAETH